uniref:Uncharacterized protein n=1 Tax=Wuchereria bancrofti TaxID=6293 RepID=A0AAF5PKC4_WUCBA
MKKMNGNCLMSHVIKYFFLD